MAYYSAIILSVSTAFIGSVTQDTEKEYCYVQITQGVFGKVYVAYSTGEKEVFDLLMSDKVNLPENGLKISKVFKHIAKKGYSLKTSNGGDIQSFYVFEK